MSAFSTLHESVSGIAREFSLGTSLHQDGAAVRLNPSETFGSHALSWRAIASQLESSAANAFEAFVRSGTPMDKSVANRLGEVVLRWAQSLGATHYAHWFQPITGQPAEKHDAFMTLQPGPNGDMIGVDELKGSLLLQGEPDASSFPSGGLRATHTARGYTVWDPRTPLFVRDEANARTLLIPCAFVSYTGHALDHKTPLLRALSALDKAATRFLGLVTGKAAGHVTATLGAEQEYFLIDRAHFMARPDLVMTGRTLMGNVPERNQQLEDHYFGPIRARVQAFMVDAERELYRLGVPVKTRHCEVAPGQFELAPVFEEASVSCDHNVLTMDVLVRVAERHGLACLLHEKPFAGINGSGKHNNWSMSTDAGENLLDPGHNEAEQLRFMAVLAAVLRAVHQHADALRVTIASPGNDHRLGANEAPPSIISAYLGEAIDAMATAAETGAPITRKVGELLAISDRLKVQLDATDRNRTAPFAFTGNKFEFRAVGSSDNCAWPMTVLNTAVAQAMNELSDRLERSLKAGDRRSAVLEVVKEAIAESRSARFEGNGYSEEWVEEAARRGLPNLRNTPAALAVLEKAESTRFLTDLGVLSADEVHSRFEIHAERYLKKLDIEAATLIDMARRLVVPALESQIGQTGGAIALMQAANVRRERAATRFARLADVFDRVLLGIDDLEKARESAHELSKVTDILVPAMASLRSACDEAETIVGAATWPMPTYRDLLFPAR